MENDLKETVFMALAMEGEGSCKPGKVGVLSKLGKAGNRPFPRHPQDPKPCQHLNFSAPTHISILTYRAVK